MWLSRKEYNRIQLRIKNLENELYTIKSRVVRGVLTTVWNLCDQDYEQNPTIVSFAMTSGDWYKLQESEHWKLVEEQILRSQREHSQTSLRGWID